MKNILKTLPLALIVMSIYSCTSDDETVQDANDNSSVVTTFTCTQENDGTATKAALDSDSKTIMWKTGDAISIFDGAGNKQFTLKAESDGQKSGSFTGKCNESDSYVAVYPYTEGATLNDDGKFVSNIVLPDEQKAVDNGFDPKAALMIAKSETTTLTFKNAVGFIKVTPQFNCKKIILRAANKTQPLAGKGKINFTDPEKPYIDFTGSTELSYSITLSGTITSGNAYYIAVPAVTLYENWTLTFVTENKNYMRQVANPITFVRSKALNLGTFSTSDGKWVGSSGIVSAGQEVDLGLTITKDGKTYNVIFAKSNLTATGLAAKESDFGDYFAWAATDPWLTSYTYDGSGDDDTSFTNRTWKTGKSGGYKIENAPYYGVLNNVSQYTKYKNKTQNEVLKAADDAANVILGGDWQLPTKEIWVALYEANNNTVYWGNNGDEQFIGDEKGMKITKKGESGTYIFLPAAGYVGTIWFQQVGYQGYYWSGTACFGTDAYKLDFSGTIVNEKYYRERYYGFSVRPVRLVAVNP